MGAGYDKHATRNKEGTKGNEKMTAKTQEFF